MLRYVMLLSNVMMLLLDSRARLEIVQERLWVLTVYGTKRERRISRQKLAKRQTPGFFADTLAVAGLDCMFRRLRALLPIG